MNNKHNEFSLSFSFFNEEFKPGNCLIDLFSDCFSFHSHFPNIKKHIEKLDDKTFRASSNPSSAIIISDASIKNHITMLISHIHSFNKHVVKTIHRVVNVTITEAKLFTIQCSINQAIDITNVNHIVVITNSLHAARRIFDFLLYPYQIHSAVISQKLREFFLKDVSNCIEFWDCSSKQKWLLHYLVDKDFKNIVFIPLFPCKSSWNFCRKNECDLILLQ